MTDIQQEAGMCARCWGKAFTAAYGIGSKTQAGEYERIVASCACTPAQRYGVADSFAAGYTARDKEIEEARNMAADAIGMTVDQANEIGKLRRRNADMELTQRKFGEFMHGKLDEIEEFKSKLKEASGDAAILAHAYGTDNRPPTNVVVRSIERGKMALENKP